MKPSVRPPEVELPPADEIDHLGAILKAVGALAKARVRCLSVDEVLARLDREPLLPYEQRRLMFLPLREQSMSVRQMQRLGRLIDRWAAMADPDRRTGDRLYGLIRSALELMPREFRVERCLNYLGHRHIRRRQIACGLLKEEPLTDHEVQVVWEAVQEAPVKLALELAARHAAELSPEACLQLLPILDSPYWRMRVIEATLDRWPNAVQQRIAGQFPVPFISAAARMKRPELLGRLSHSVAELIAEDVQSSALIILALGQLRRPADLDAAEEALRSLPAWPSYEQVFARAADQSRGRPKPTSWGELSASPSRG